MTNLRASDLSVHVGEKRLVDAASFELKPGDLTILLGPNGAGKTSLLRAALGLQKTATGTSELDGDSVFDMAPAKRAKHIAYLPQIRPLAWPNRVRDVVSLGRYAHGAAVGKLGPDDARAVDRALSVCDLNQMADRAADTLSGGELARMHFARALAAEAPLLIADEPTAALDPRHQFRILDLIQSYVQDGGGALLVLHDIELAARYATQLIWMKAGRIVSQGSVEETLTKDRLAEVYDISAEVQGTRISMKGAL